MSFVSHLKSHLINIPGWRSKRKIVVFESDDWGSIRTPSYSALASLKETGLAVERCQYMMNDALESSDDLNGLFEVLLKYQDANGQPAKFTANTIVANPNFERIKEADFSSYYFEPFTDTYLRNPATASAFQTFKTGLAKGVFWPQLHGREHLNVYRWITDLKQGVEETMLAFELQMTGISTHISKLSRRSYQAAFDGGGSEPGFEYAQAVEDAVSIFASAFGFRPLSFIAPNYTWNKIIEDATFHQGIKYIQGGTAQRVPQANDSPNKIVRHYLGQRNRNQQLYLVRNAHFEPTLNQGIDSVQTCLKQVSRAFLWGKPAIICTHRANYIDSISEGNAERSLKQLSVLLQELLKRWPDVEFMSSDELGKLIEKDERA